MTYFLKPSLLLLFLFNFVFFYFTTNAAGDFSDTDKYAWSESSGWIDFNPAGGDVTVHDTHLSGYAWSENFGYIHMGRGEGPYANTGADDYGVNVDNGALSGFAWSESVGWIGFDGVRIREDGVFEGFAWSENMGYIHFNGDGYRVRVVDTEPPQVSSVSPENGETGIAVNTSVSAVFSEEMDESTLTTATFTVSDGVGEIPGTVTCSGTTAKFDPVADLDENTDYRAVITILVADLAGNALEEEYAWQFTTGGDADLIAPFVVSETPADGAEDAAVNTRIEIRFSEPMDASTIDETVLRLSGGGTDISGQVLCVGDTAVFTPDDDLEFETEYLATVGADASDLAGNPLGAEHAWRFTADDGPDGEPPFILSTDPETDAVGVDSDTKITVIFSEGMDPSTLTAVSFFVDGIEGSVELDGRETVILTPFGPLDINTEYTATVTTAARDLAGNEMESDYAWTFATGDGGPNAPPEAPQCASPAHEAVVRSGTVILRAGEFSDPDGDRHSSSEWFVKRADRVYGCPEYEESFEYVANSGDLTAHEIPVEDGLKYVWRVEYTDHRGMTSASSPEYAFKAGHSGSGGPIVVDGGASEADCRMVSFANWPGDPSSRMTVGHVVGDYNIFYHRVAGYDPASGQYVEYGDSLDMVPGKSYWICARDGADFSYSGVPVSLNHDIEVGLSQGWNMIACPNARGYSWGRVEILGYDANGNYTINPVTVSNSGGAYVDMQLWRWENGDYESDTEFLAPGEGYWVKSYADGVWLRFPVSAVASGSHIQKTGRARNHADEDKPPPPPNGFSDLTDSGGGGCFVDVSEGAKQGL